MSGQTLQMEQHRSELTGYCYRILGSSFESEDAVQETMVRAWKSIDRFEGRSSLRSWLYRIAHNVCLDMLGSAQRRIRPMDLSGTFTYDGEIGDPLAESIWVSPMPDSQVLSGDPAESAVAKDSLRLAFVAALQHLPPRQRAVLVLREALNWSAAEVAELLDSTVASVNSALQRARATIAAAQVSETDTFEPLDKDQQDLLGRYVGAFEDYDLDSLTNLLHDDAVLSMPPLPLWLQGTDQIRGWMLGKGSVCRGSKLVPTIANGSPAFGQYHSTQTPGRWEPWALQVIEIRDGRIAGLNSFLNTSQLFPLFGLAPVLEARSPAVPHGGR